VISRRELLTSAVLAGPTLLSLQAAAVDRSGELRHGVADLEQKHGGRLGVAVLNSANNKLVAHRGDERFALCSTFKFLAAAFVLARVDRKEERLTRRVTQLHERLGMVGTRSRHSGGNHVAVADRLDFLQIVFLDQYVEALEHLVQGGRPA
jgi:beta-lactamase class A